MRAARSSAGHSESWVPAPPIGARLAGVCVAEDKIVGALPLGLTPEKITIVPVEEVFAK